MTMQDEIASGFGVKKICSAAGGYASPSKGLTSSALFSPPTTSTAQTNASVGQSSLFGAVGASPTAFEGAASSAPSAATTPACQLTSVPFGFSSTPAIPPQTTVGPFVSLPFPCASSQGLSAIAIQPLASATLLASVADPILAPGVSKTALSIPSIPLATASAPAIATPPTNDTFASSAALVVPTLPAVESVPLGGTPIAAVGAPPSVVPFGAASVGARKSVIGKAGENCMASAIMPVGG